MNQIFWYECGSGNINSNLVGYYKFENNVTDSTGILPAATGTGIDFVVGKQGQAVRFDASSDRVDIPDTTFLSFTSGGGVDIPFSISMWVYFTGFSSTGNWFINKRNATSLGDEWQFIYFENKLQLHKFDRNSNSIIQGVASPVNPFLLNTWYFIVCTDNGTKTNAGMKLYVNGTAQTTTNANSGGTYTGMNNGTAISRIGRGAWDLLSLTSHQGYIDEASIWKNKVLTETEINFLYNSGNGRTYPFIF